MLTCQFNKTPVGRLHRISYGAQRHKTAQILSLEHSMSPTLVVEGLCWRKIRDLGIACGRAYPTVIPRLPHAEITFWLQSDNTSAGLAEPGFLSCLCISYSLRSSAVYPVAPEPPLHTDASASMCWLYH